MTTGSNALVIREINVNLVRQALKSKQEATKHQIAELTGLSTVTVTTILQKLVEDQEVFEAGLVPSMGGRPAQQFRFNENHAHVLVLFMHEQAGLDVLHLQVATLLGSSIEEQNIPLDDIHLRTFEPYIDAALAAYPSIRAIGFGLPGVELDGKIILLDYQALVGTEFLAHYRSRYSLPVIFENDVNAAAVGYCRSHEIDAEAATVYLYFPQKYAPGGGIYINGRLYKGFSNYAGEVATVPLDVDWRDPELYTSTDRISDAIARLIITISSLLNPHTIVLYGSFLTEVHLNRIRQTCAQQLFSISIPTIRLTSDFTLDYQTGMIEQTLALLDPQISISFERM